jgi:hypothetical protein
MELAVMVSLKVCCKVKKNCKFALFDDIILFDFPGKLHVRKSFHEYFGISAQNYIGNGQ